jgi:hypothetical protein
MLFLTSNVDNASVSSSSRTVYRPLPDSERKLLGDHQGCTKCRQFFVNHHPLTCPNGYGLGLNHKVLTMADVSAARLQTNKVVDSATVLWFSAPVAAIIPLPDVSAILLGGDSDISKDSDGSVSPSSVLFYVSHSPRVLAS